MLGEINKEEQLAKANCSIQGISQGEWRKYYVTSSIDRLLGNIQIR